MNAAADQDYPFPEEPRFGSIRLGTSKAGDYVGLDPEDLMKHFLAIGQSGSGKTTLFYQLFSQLTVPCWSFDLKRDYRHLTQHHQNLLVLPWWQLKFNPLRPPKGVSPLRWAQVFSEIFCHATALLQGSKNHLLKQLIDLYKQYDLFEDNSGPYPSTHELEQYIEANTLNYMRKSSDYQETLLNRLEPMNLTGGPIFDCSRGYGIEDLLQRNIVFEFDGLTRDLQNFLMEILFAYVYEYRLAANQRDDGLNHIFFLDEGKRVFSVYKERQEASGIPEIDQLTAKMREFGEGLVVADQEATKLTDSLKANTYTKLLLPTGEQKQREEMAAAMSLSERQSHFAQQLQVGEGIIQVGTDDPIPVSLDNYVLDKSVTDDELQKRQAQHWNQLSHEPRRAIPGFDQSESDTDSVDIDEVTPEPETELSLSDTAVRMLEHVLENPFVSLSDRYDEFSSTYKGNQAKDELVDAGVVVERKIRHGDAKRKLLELTETGRDFAENDLNLDTKHQGRGGVIHRYWQHRIKETFEEAGWTAELEVFDSDVYVNMDKLELAIEVAMGINQREIGHVKQRLNHDFAALWIVCRNKEIRDGIKSRLSEQDLLSEDVAFRLFRDFSDAELHSNTDLGRFGDTE